MVHCSVTASPIRPDKLTASNMLFSDYLAKKNYVRCLTIVILIITARCMCGWDLRSCMHVLKMCFRICVPGRLILSDRGMWNCLPWFRHKLSIVNPTRSKPHVTVKVAGRPGDVKQTGVWEDTLESEPQAGNHRESSWLQGQKHWTAKYRRKGTKTLRLFCTCRGN